MFIQILKNTPPWAWALLAALFTLGFAQSRTRQVSLKRATLVPLAFIGFSAIGAVGTFATETSTLIEWVSGFLIAASLLKPFVAVRGAKWSPHTRQFTVPGSLIPLTLMLGVFLLKYAVGVALALHRDWAHDTLFATVAALAYGAFAGLFWARAQSLRLLARSDTLPTEPSLSP